MKFQMPSWDDSPETWTAFHRVYSEHLESLVGVLPARALELARLGGVDDGLIVDVSHDRAGRVLRLTLRCGHLQMGYYDLVLTYEDADITPEDEWCLARLARGMMDSRYAADLRRHEVDVTEEGKVEHRLEFHLYDDCAWFAIWCGALEWETVDRPDRELPALLDRFPGGPMAEATQ